MSFAGAELVPEIAKSQLEEVWDLPSPVQPVEPKRPIICARCKRQVTIEGLFCAFCGTAIPQGDGTPDDPYVGRKVADKYFIHERIGSGGMGQLYRATDLTLERTVVLKMLNRVLFTDPSIVQRFHQEARAASRLNHPNSVDILEFGEIEDGTLFIAANTKAMIFNWRTNT